MVAPMVALMAQRLPAFADPLQFIYGAADSFSAGDTGCDPVIASRGLPSNGEGVLIGLLRGPQAGTRIYAVLLTSNPVPGAGAA